MLAAVLFAATTEVHAGRPMMVDDATLTNAKGCELDTWVQKSRTDTEYWAVPQCNFSGNLEWTLGGARIVSNGQTQTAVVMQGKTLLKPLEPDGWGLGLALSNQFNPDRDTIGDLSVNVPLSFSFQHDRLLLHVNGGWLHQKDDGRGVPTWGVGSEWQWTTNTALTSEIYRQAIGKPFYQFGIRHQLVPDRLQIDASYGDRLTGSSADRYFSVGIELSFDDLLP
jgi:hypothetical protein